jgi:hypothetical protein
VRGSAANVIDAIEAWTGQEAGEVAGGTEKEKLEATALPGVVGTWLTGSGHTIEIIARSAQGIIVNDPHGSCRGKDDYLRHGEAGEAPPAHRWSSRPDLLGVASVGEPREDWGRANLYTWDEVDEFSIGKWVVSTK